LKREKKIALGFDMRRFYLLSAVLTLAVFLCACERQAKPSLPWDERLSEQARALDSTELWAVVESACAKGTNGAHVRQIIGENIYEAGIVTLTRQAPGELSRKMDTRRRGTARHPWTEAQLEEAMRRKGVR
jgi:triphosphoribosyl-dephospho-CoA synthetase